MKFYYCKSNETNVYRNLAIESYLSRFVKTEIAILFLWQNDDTIVVGRNQDVYRECKAQDFISIGGTIARRKSGGGAVFHDLGNLNFSIICNAIDREKFQYHTLVNNVLNICRIQSSYNKNNDILIGGKKISGKAEYVSNGIACLHGTLLVNTNLEKMAYYLTPDKTKLKKNQVSSIISRVINLKSIVENISIEELINMFILTTEASKIEYSECNEIDILTEFFKRDSWVYGGNL